MRLPTRRTALRLGLGGVAVLGATFGYSHTRRFGGDEAVALDITAKPIRSFDPTRPDERRFGALVFRSGLELSASSGFGGLSGLWRDPDGARIVAVSDHAQWLTAGLVHDGGRLVRLADAMMSPILGADGVPLRQGKAYDCEALAIAGGEAFVGIERTHDVLRFAFAESGVRAYGHPIELPAEVRRQPPNRGIEALCVAPVGHPLAGSLIAFAEAPETGDEDPTPGWVLTGPDRFAFRVAKSARFNVTDALILPSGELILLERSFSPARGAGCRIRRIARDAIRPGAMLDGEVLLEVDDRFEIDNMEGLAAHRDTASGETVLTLVSDDNFMPFQRTLLLEFTLAA